MADSGKKLRRLIASDGIPIPQPPKPRMAGGGTVTWPLDTRMYDFRGQPGNISVRYFLCFDPFPKAFAPPPRVSLNSLIPAATRQTSIGVPVGRTSVNLTITAGVVPGVHHVLVVVTADGRSDFMRLRIRGPALRGRKSRKIIRAKRK